LSLTSKRKAVRPLPSRATSPKRTTWGGCFEETKKTFGGLDILVNNAGIYRFARLEEITENEFHQHFNINVLGTILATREAVKYGRCR